MSIALALALCVAPGAAQKPEFAITLSEELLAGLLSAAMPLTLTSEQDLGVAGRAQLTVTLSEPQVRVTNAAIRVTMNYRVRDSSGLVDASGLAKPDLVIVPVPNRGVFEARFTRLVVTLPAGIEMPLEGFIKPIQIPGIIREDVSFGPQVISVEGRGNDVQLETGKVHLRGVMTFKASAAPGGKASHTPPPR